tara:strand:+ start:6947 stop:7159 length:213 start_codon:yes stop_codon:yes gene_type:complete
MIGAITSGNNSREQNSQGETLDEILETQLKLLENYKQTFLLEQILVELKISNKYHAIAHGETLTEDDLEL